eukprot:TRINITY_DN983_c0_g1_i1.p1 TRINITY_DN983_c0_g1~~TRINITY_DN983_c0_g1_i1.p1  ORF type:complete len:124 (+),score=16.62 TRINITY_DN983_c0_g1_i1:64-435(+)
MTPFPLFFPQIYFIFLTGVTIFCQAVKISLALMELFLSKFPLYQLLVLLLCPLLLPGDIRFEVMDRRFESPLPPIYCEVTFLKLQSTPVPLGSTFDPLVKVLSGVLSQYPISRLLKLLFLGVG